MEPVFRQTVTLTDIYLDCHRRLKPASLLYFIQNIAGCHAMELGTGWEVLAQKHLFWALIRHKIQITRMPMAGETITIETWPMPTTRVAYPRATVAYDAEGKELFRSVALWVLMDLQTRAMVLPGKSGVTVNGLMRGTELDIPPSILPKKLENVMCRTVRFSELDRNGHMNNTHYMNWIADLLPSSFHREHPVKEITLCYLSEALEGQELCLSWDVDEQGALSVDGFRKDPENPEKTHRVFAARLEF